MIRRWMTVSGEAWGRSPCTSLALADSRTLNIAQRLLLEGLEKAIDPPMIANQETVSGPIQLMAGGVTYADGYNGRVGDHLQPVQEAARLDYGMEFTRERREFLSRVFLQNILKLPTDKNMTAFEVGERIEEFLRSAAPVFEPMEAENGVMMDVVFDIAMQNEAYLPPPDVLQGREVRFEFETPLSIAYRRLKLEKARQLRAEIAEVVAAGYQDAPMYVAWERMLEDIFDGIGVPDWAREQEDVVAQQNEQMMAQRAQELLQVAQSMPPEAMASLTGGDMVDPALMEQPVREQGAADPMAGMAV
jgi:hypothetical protein